MKNKAFFLVGFCSPCNTSRFVCISTYFSHGTKSKGAAHAFDFYEFLLLLLLLFFVSWQATRFHSSWNSIEVFINSYFFLTTLRISTRIQKSLRAVSDYPQGDYWTYMMLFIWQRKITHRDFAHALQSFLFYFKWTCLWL